MFAFKIKSETAVSFLILIFCYFLNSKDEMESKQIKSIHQVENEGVLFNSSANIIFIGGVPKSGTTLMRVLLDIHPQIRCGPETHIFIDILKLRYEWMNFPELHDRNQAAGITQQIVDSAVTAFLLEVTARHGNPAPIICIKEPFLMTQGNFLSTAFPNSKLIHMVRDGRAVSHSLVKRNLNFPPFSPSDHLQNLKSWSRIASGMFKICSSIGNERCQTIRYEDLVHQTGTVMKKVLKWLGLEWEPNILRHSEHMSNVDTSHLESTADQIVRPVYKEAVAQWRGNIPQEILSRLEVYGEALQQFGYPTS